MLALAFLVLLNLFIKRLTRPLHTLSGLMMEARLGDTNVRAPLEGPTEVQYIGDVFNRMMDALEERDQQLRKHNEMLETEVTLRTKELISARDTAIAANRAKSEFLANVTHELRTPLQAIIGYTDVVSETLQDEGLDEVVEDMERILSSAQHLLSLINNVLDLAKIEAGRMELRLNAVDLAQLIDEARATVLPLISQHHNRIETSVESCAEPLVIDYGRMLQILLNLASNAGKFTENGLIRIRAVHSPTQLLIAVEDSGVGLTPEQLTVIFDQFRQVDGNATRHLQGTGLGLAITRQLCRLMGGDIVAVSKKGVGSTFTVTVPLPIAPHK